ncbi:MAG: DUF2029 domain-containing protein [Desulfarculus sp.]|nr:MAG: DUF2029 domain-containing protein [Desulfarculus sp.]
MAGSLGGSFGGYWRLWWWCGLALALTLLAAAALAPRFAADAPAPPILALAALLMLAGGFYLWALRGLPQGGLGAGPLAWLLLLGLGLRLAMFAGPPMLENDHYRFLWDGAVTAQGLNPYRYPPGQAQQDPAAPPELGALARQAPRVLERINYPHLRSLYPPVCQAAFALAHWLNPWSLLAWRLVLLAADALSLLLLWRLLRRLGLPLAGLAVYWWNPLLVKEVYNSGHLEVLIFPFLLGALLLALTGRRVWAAGVLGLALGVKLWPGLLLPLLLRPLLARPARLAAALVLFGGVSAALLWTLLAAGLDEESGLVAYAGRWQMNDSAFMLLSAGLGWLLGLAGAAGWGPALARGLTAAAVLAWALWLAWRDEAGPADLPRRALLLVAGLFLLSPTQFPWYYLWLLPLLALWPLAPLLWLTALLPLYYLRFWLAARGQAAFYDHWLVWIIYLPVWAGLVWQWRRGRRAWS